MRSSNLKGAFEVEPSTGSSGPVFHGSPAEQRLSPLSTSETRPPAPYEAFRAGSAGVYLFPSGERLSPASTSSAPPPPPSDVPPTVTVNVPDRMAGDVEAEWRELVDPAFRPARTEIGALLRRLRRVALASGGKLRSWDEIESLMDQIRGRQSAE